MEFMGMAAVTVISVICYLVGEAVKLSPLDNKWIPLVCGIAGAMLGVAAMHSMADFPARDILSAIAVGIVSGLAATGANELVVQVKK